MKNRVFTRRYSRPTLNKIIECLEITQRPRNSSFINVCSTIAQSILHRVRFFYFCIAVIRWIWLQATSPFFFLFFFLLFRWLNTVGLSFERVATRIRLGSFEGTRLVFAKLGLPQFGLCSTVEIRLINPRNVITDLLFSFFLFFLFFFFSRSVRWMVGLSFKRVRLG